MIKDWDEGGLGGREGDMGGCKCMGEYGRLGGIEDMTHLTLVIVMHPTGRLISVLPVT